MYEISERSISEYEEPTTISCMKEIIMDLMSQTKKNLWALIAKDNVQADLLLLLVIIIIYY